ncbi:hypothetical protein [Polyangium sp. 6x1]|uniref:hypothetical protein n=1 Tax=Polyangium sp. 6x1 TaxID=3042689 RepID=UPI002482BD0C|nr:hypothetical protein [Polyangium sp. 6x1]MDI1448634.1 hypothetical protein [Polyangium sp. 6x1]
MSFLRLLGVVGLSAFFVGCGGEVPETSFEDPGTALWARRFGQGSGREPVGLAGVASGGVIVTGSYHGVVNFGGDTLQSPGNNHQAYVARYDGEGKHVYSRAFGTELAEMSNDVAVFPDGSALIGGTFGWSFDLDGISLPWDGNDDAFVAKLDPAGKVVWAHAFGGAGWQEATAVAAMPDGGAIVAGTTRVEVDLGIGEPQDFFLGAFLVRLDAKGTPSWAQMIETDGYVFVAGIAVQGDTIAVVGNAWANWLDVGLDDGLLPVGSAKAFVVTYDFEGKPALARTLGVEGNSPAVKAVALTGDGGLVLTGGVRGNVDFGGGLFPGSQLHDENTYLLELDAALNHRRSFLYGGDNDDRGDGIAMTAGGGVILAGQVYGPMSFGEASVAPPDDDSLEDAFVAELDADRNPVFLRRFGGMGMQSGQQAAVDGQGRVYVAGTAVGTVDFGLGPTPGTGYFETFVVALAP